MRTLLLLAAMTSIGICGCRSNRAVTAEDVQQKAEPVAIADIDMKPKLLASIERTACFGRCPMYKITYMDNGEVTYVGRRFVEKTGTYEALLDQEDIMNIRRKAEELGYFKLDSLYPTTIADFPSCITEMNLDGRHLRVVDRYDPPDDLRAFEKFLDSLLQGRELRKLSDRTDYGKK